MKDDFNQCLDNKMNIESMILYLHTLKKVIPSEKKEIEKMYINLNKLNENIDIILKALSIY